MKESLSYLPLMKQQRKVIMPLAFIFFIVIAASIYAFCYLKYDPSLTNLEKRLEGMSMAHPLGTDHLGRDILTRLLLGAKQTIGFSALALGVALLVGIPIGLISGYKRGLIDRLFMRIADSFLAFPDTVVAIVLSGLLGPGIGNLVFAIVMVKWVNYARLVRSTVLAESRKEYVLIARTNGLSPLRIMKKHLAPHIIGHVLVMASLDLGKIVLLISSLSYIGLGAQPPVPEWGAMLNDSRPYFQSNPELMIYPGLAIVGVVLVTNIIGDYLRDQFDVKKEVQK
ncbi:nickel transporter permease [Bacillus sp. CBEL-1]|uniref:nickel transporter permease n=1 Tax=Bacillus sp. CBEL-1 TaxID=2502980 RepID=UPI00104A1FEC|nr:nickel transporter permease [Bacillus sp. CBEL-1]TDB49781.1 ABC transporter permease subunit [Bacillus sp. CBEL-1]